MIWTVLAQVESVPRPVGAEGVENVFEGMVLLLVFAAVVVFTLLGVALFSRGWESYEEKYMEEAERSFEAMFLTVPPYVMLYLSSVLFFLVALSLAVMTGGRIALSLVGGGVAALLPRFFLRRLKKRREKKFRAQLLPALQSLSNNLKAGFSLPKSWEQLEKEATNPMKQEVRILLQELRLGSTMQEAIDGLHQRLPSDDLSLVATAIHIAGRVGGNLPNIFKNLEDIIRERNRIEGKVGSMTSQGRLQAVVVAMMPIFLVLVLSVINPELIRPLFTTTVGWVMVGLVFLLDFMGYWIIRKIVSIEI